MKFTVNGDIKIVAAYDMINELLKVQVIDTGIGVNAENVS